MSTLDCHPKQLSLKPEKNHTFSFLRPIGLTGFRKLGQQSGTVSHHTGFHMDGPRFKSLLRRGTDGVGHKQKSAGYDFPNRNRLGWYPPFILPFPMGTTDVMPGAAAVIL